MSSSTLRRALGLWVSLLPQPRVHGIQQTQSTLDRLLPVGPSWLPLLRPCHMSRHHVQACCLRQNTLSPPGPSATTSGSSLYDAHSPQTATCYRRGTSSLRQLLSRDAPWRALLQRHLRLLRRARQQLLCHYRRQRHHRMYRTPRLQCPPQLHHLAPPNLRSLMLVGLLAQRRLPRLRRRGITIHMPTRAQAGVLSCMRWRARPPRSSMCWRARPPRSRRCPALYAAP